ncbi:glycine cleavage system protein H [Lactiplantibacillus mudanjiangensis]|uniref:Glycine cleavage system, H protein [Lactobacillus plantarum ZJ316] n=1 Tax=Lactiplantibacillus mudanjiangensis TaxID=1296538 RepID=A0A660E2R8_9LACO|nr:glycine cleavage system protein H [Lactiplantibacillus mudanjiangensis]VDG19156.1 Glycine cleavage system, H protein [Lactobacillus plantarum ZJ316] [Lactiplantibacillus mudanjiangensis]VDG25678.1 Glycine cleavage system, H protein [Lactobacillus plantarum ZJ316] [Lactiplantibacillus mudanjiangensis]VDG29925.1 Glycine cleavage system, H protein [Lactobacillus plantarum ZJ316] [Lactiplantibacillus mudanjiangensis]VDG33227.1 Glycine cleavage system, H protein [Lactobacillus plantarum ZJ316] [L
MSEDATYFWTKDTDGHTRIGLTKSAHEALGEIKYAELPVIGDKVSQNKAFLSVEATKAVSEFNCPINGTVVAVNPALKDNFDALNSLEDGVAWLVDVD